MRKNSRTKTDKQAKSSGSIKFSGEMSHVEMSSSGELPVLPETEITLTDPLKSSPLPPQVAYNPLNRDEQFIGMGTTQMIVMETPIPIELIKDPRQPKPQKTCCEKHPQPPAIKITGIRFNADGKSLDVSVSASHPCGLRRLALYVMDVNYSVDAQGKVTKTYTPHRVDGKFLGADGTLPAPFPKQTHSTAKFPHASLWGKPHGLRLVVLCNCDLDGQHFRFSRLDKDFLLI